MSKRLFSQRQVIAHLERALADKRIAAVGVRAVEDQQAVGPFIVSDSGSSSAMPPASVPNASAPGLLPLQVTPRSSARTTGALMACAVAERDRRAEPRVVEGQRVGATLPLKL